MTSFLAIDFETTGLDVMTSTALEGSWCIINLDGSQRMPLQHRFMALRGPSGSRTVPVKFAGEHLRWSNEPKDTTAEFACKMAQDSLLMQDYVDCPPQHILQSGAELERLLLDDITAFCKPNETVHVCGAGAARFDFSILALHCPRVVLPRGKRGQVHYRPVDTSGNQTGLLGGNFEKLVIDWYLKQDNANADVSLDEFPRYCYKNSDVALWLSATEAPHRAAPDVFRAIMVQRALWTLGKPLREVLGFEGTTVS